MQVTVRVRQGKPVAVFGKTCKTPVPKTAVELVRGGSMGDGIAGIEPVCQILVEYAQFAFVPDSAKPVTVGGILT